MILTLGVFTSHSQAEGAIDELRAFGIDEADLSYIYENKEGDVKDEQTGNKVGVGATTGAAGGAVIGGIAGLIVANGILPGFGTLFVAGPLIAALGLTGATGVAVAGAATGAVAGGLIGGLQHLGVDKKDVQLYEDHIHQGHIVVIARDSSKSTQDIFLDQGAVEVKEYTMA